jgi:hypothetical protein
MATAPTRRRHKKQRSAVRAWSEYVGVKTLLAGMHTLSLDSASNLMARIVGAGILVSPRLRHIGLDNLQRAFPEHDPQWHRDVLHGSFRSLGRMLGEIAFFDELRPGNIHERIGFISTSIAERRTSGYEQVVLPRTSQRRPRATCDRLLPALLLATSLVLNGCPVTPLIGQGDKGGSSNEDPGPPSVFNPTLLDRG